MKRLYYNESMFSSRICSESNCHTYALKGRDKCYQHIEGRSEVLSEMTRLLTEEKHVEDESILNAEFEGLDISKARILSSNFSFCVFRHCNFDGAAIRDSFFDYAIFDSCFFRDSDIDFSVFAGSTMRNTTFEGSSIIRTSFMAMDSFSSIFDSSDLYLSNFSLSKLILSSFDDCNLKRVNFRSTINHGTTFRYSNPEEAFFQI